MNQTLLAPRLVLPTKSLAEPNELEYVPAIWQTRDGILARWLRGEPVGYSDAECTAVAEAMSMQPENVR